jgi:hypothetical protein
MNRSGFIDRQKIRAGCFADAHLFAACHSGKPLITSIEIGNDTRFFSGSPGSAFRLIT